MRPAAMVDAFNVLPTKGSSAARFWLLHFIIWTDDDQLHAAVICGWKVD